MRHVPKPSELENISIGTKEGWSAVVNAPPTTRPERLTIAAYEGLSARERAVYNRGRYRWHANSGVLRTEQLQFLHNEFNVILTSNMHRGDRVKGAIALEGPAYTGKSTLVELFASNFHREQVADYGSLTEQGNERWPICRVTLSGHPTMKALNFSLLNYFAHPAARSGSAEVFARRALETFRACEVRLLVVDDMHFLKWGTSDGKEVSNHLKFLANEFPITLLIVGVGLTQHGLYREGNTYCDESLTAQAQRTKFYEEILGPTARRTTSYSLQPFAMQCADDARQWRSVVHAIETRLVLLKHPDGLLAEGLSDYLFARSTGYMGSLTNLINRASARAIIEGTEALAEDVLERTRIDVAAEEARKGTEAKLRHFHVLQKRQRDGRRSPA